MNYKVTGGGYYSFAQMCSNYHNIGEEVQWVAQERFLPHVDYLVNKDRISCFHPKEPTKLIMSGWHTKTPKRFVPHPNIEPLLISIYVHRSCYKDFQKQKIKSFLKAHEPVGCRDKSTVRFLEGIGVDAYYSGCLTLTLQRNPHIRKQDYILSIGLNDKQEEYLRAHTTHPVISMDRLVPQIYAIKQRLDIAKAFIGLYQSAHCIVTNKMHVAVPALAVETPVLLIDIDKDDLKNDPERLEGVKELCHCVSPKDFENGKFEYDFDNPPENPKDYLIYRQKLIETCVKFTGFNNEKTLLPDEPLELILRYFSWTPIYQGNYWRTLYYIPNKLIFKHLFRKIFKRRKGADLK